MHFTWVTLSQPKQPFAYIAFQLDLFSLYINMFFTSVESLSHVQFYLLLLHVVAPFDDCWFNIVVVGCRLTSGHGFVYGVGCWKRVVLSVLIFWANLVNSLIPFLVKIINWSRQLSTPTYFVHWFHDEPNASIVNKMA